MDKRVSELTSPRITVLMPVYNAEKYLSEAIVSILGQTYPHFHLLIINDGSTDQTDQVVRKFSDERIIYHQNEQNIGLVKTLNKGLSLIKTEFIARMDADDISLPERFEEQVLFMDSHKDVGVCGTGYEIFGNESGFPPVVTGDAAIKASLLFGNLLLHPSVMIRSSVIQDHALTFGVPFNYNDSYGHKLLELEDYALWYKMMSYTRFANIDKVLLKYRIEGQNITYSKVELIRERKYEFFQFLLDELSVKPSREVLLLHFDLQSLMQIKDPELILQLYHHFMEIIRNNDQKMVYDPAALRQVVSERWKRVFYYIAPLGLRFALQFWRAGGFSSRQLVYFLKLTINQILGRGK